MSNMSERSGAFWNSSNTVSQNVSGLEQHFRGESVTGAPKPQDKLKTITTTWKYLQWLLNVDSSLFSVRFVLYCAQYRKDLVHIQYLASHEVLLQDLESCWSPSQVHVSLFPLRPEGGAAARRSVNLVPLVNGRVCVCALCPFELFLKRTGHGLKSDRYDEPTLTLKKQ